jgi:hypothetical protein
MNSPISDPSLFLPGAQAVAELFFLTVEPPDPLEEFPALRVQGRSYNLWLTEEILQPALARWCRPGPSDQPDSEAIRTAFAAASDAARLAFAQILPLANAEGEPAVLAAMGVTANLQRTLAILAEFILEEHPPAGPTVFRLSRRWAGLFEYPDHAPYFPAAIKAPAAPAKPRPNRRDPRHLSNSLWCSAEEVKARCAEALERLRREVRQDRGLSGE